MAPKATPKCLDCQTVESIWWVSLSNAVQICFNCNEKRKAITPEVTDTMGKIKMESDIENKQSEERKLRKSTRSTRYKSKNSTQPLLQTKTNNGSHDGNNNGNHTGNNNNNHTSNNNMSKNQLKGRSRRNLFKKNPVKHIPPEPAEVHTVNSVFHKSIYMQIGDIVSVVDHEDNIYYAQIRGLLVDTYNEKSAYLTWLLPTQSSPDPKLGFDPPTYIIGPDEDQARKLSCLEYVMHAPSNYYYDKTTPFPLPDSMVIPEKPGGYIWTRLPEYHRKA